MKNCPSCAARIETHLKKCSACGYEFPEANANKTMMGLPAVSFPMEEKDAPDPGKQTLFGFPAQKASSFQSYDEEDEEEDDSTHLIPASQLQQEFQGDTPQRAQVEPVKVENKEKVPSMKSAWGLEEESDGPKTAMVSLPSAFSDASDSAGFSLRNEAQQFPEHQTLMGMNLAELGVSKPAVQDEEEPGRSTQFGIPAVQKPAAPPKVEMDSGPVSGEMNDSPTEMWNPMSEIAAAEAKGDRKALLEKLRKGGDAPLKTTTEEHIKPGGQVMPTGIAEGKAPSIPAPTVDAADLRARLQAKLKASSLDSTSVDPVSPSKLPAPVKVDAPVVESPAKTEAPGAAIGRIQLAPKQVAPKQVTPEPVAPAPTPAPPREGVLFSPDSNEDDFAFADTGIAPADLVSKIQGMAPPLVEEPIRVDGRPTDFFEQVPAKPNPRPIAPAFPEAPAPLAPPQPQPISPSTVEPMVSQPVQTAPRAPVMTPMPSPEPGPHVPMATSPESSSAGMHFGMATTPEVSSMGMSLAPVAHTTPPPDDQVGPVWLQRIPALLGGLMLMVAAVVAVLSEADLIQNIGAGAFGVSGLVLIAVTLSGLPNTLRRVLWGALGALVGCVFSLYLMLFGMIPAAMGIPAFCGGLFAVAAATIRILYSKTS